MNTVPNFTSPEVKADRAIQFALKSFQSAMRLLTSPDCWPWQIKGYRPASKQDIEAAYYRAVAKGPLSKVKRDTPPRLTREAKTRHRYQP
ncbi:hypothetical protein [Enterobacter hormaechei]|uniref:hypothetical protein n=1 Tax=Enterobacter hormaechei TaxID=158836 RepID=UPI003890F4B8